MMDAETSMKNESFELEELQKQQIHYQDKDLQSEDKSRKIIKKYQTRVQNLLKIVHSQKKQNDHLKTELKVLNSSLNNVIDRMGNKPYPQQKANRDDATKKELDNEIKKNVLLQKELQQLRAKIKTFDNQKVSEMYNEIKEKDNKIIQLNGQIKTLEKAQKQEKNMDIYRKQKELSQKVSSQDQEIIYLKKKIIEQKKHEEVLDRTIKAQHQQIINLENRVKNDKAEHKPQQTKPTEESKSQQEYNKLKQSFENLEAAKKTLQKHSRHQVENQKAKIKALEKELQQTNYLIKRKDKEANILMSKMKQSQRRNYNTLEPMEKVKNLEEYSSHGLFDQRKQFKGLAHIQGKYRKFDDTELLTLEKNYRIKKFIFTWFQEHILSLDTTYQLRDGSEKDISSFKISHNYKNLKLGELALTDFEYIKDIEIYSSKFIEFMRIRTSRDKIMEVGCQRNKVKCKQSNFDIRSHEKPIAFLGAIDDKKIVGMQKSNQYLISFGLQIKKKEVQGKVRFNPGRTDSLHKFNPKTSMDGRGKNDKNIIEQ